MTTKIIMKKKKSSSNKLMGWLAIKLRQEILLNSPFTLNCTNLLIANTPSDLLTRQS